MAETKNPVGRPLKFASVREFQAQADDYFANTPEAEWTITGLALHLGTFRDVLIDYQNRDEFSYAVKTAKQKIESSYEKSLRANGRAGDIFGLKNFGWKDRFENDNSNDNTNTNLDATDLSDDELDAKLKTLRARRKTA